MRHAEGGAGGATRPAEVKRGAGGGAGWAETNKPPRPPKRRGGPPPRGPPPPGRAAPAPAPSAFLGVEASGQLWTETSMPTGDHS